ncbi:MAG: hypothetical protein KF725_10130 [Cyclobacteriaceae bacterium]|nr:hypothetical protein [Cyclobacteriaceae bacterium]UYN86070.1 MAG: hypothetical protein KIT51_14525 [Cyclobacteriaceae bacterium]
MHPVRIVSTISITPLLILLWCMVAITVSQAQKQRVQVKTFDQQLKPYKNLELIINNSIKTNTGERGYNFVEMNESDFPIRSVEVINEGLEPASWNFSKGILEITVRKKNYRLVQVLVVTDQRQPLAKMEVTYTGVRRLKVTTSTEGRLELPLDPDEQISSADQFIIPGYRPMNLQLTGNAYTLITGRVVQEEIKPVVPSPETGRQSYQQALNQLDTARSLSSFYQVIRGIPMDNLRDEDRRIVDGRFNTLLRAMQESVRAERPARITISDSSAVAEDLRLLIEQATRESQALENQRAEFEFQIGALNRKFSSGLDNLDPESREKLLREIALLEKIIQENNTRFVANQDEFKRILDELKEKYFDISTLETRLTESESLRLQEQREFRQRILIALGVVALFSVLIVLLIRLSARLRSQKKKLTVANNEIRMINANLENIVSQRTRLLREANAELDTFLYKASHDLRTPVASIYGLCSLANHIPTEELLGKILDSNARMDRLLASLNVISEINQPSDYGDVNLRETTERILKKFTADIKRNNVQVLFSCPVGITLTTYPHLLEVVIANLVDNAIFFGSLSELREHRLVVSIAEVDQRIEITVEDNGIGIDDNIRPNIFNMFFKGTEQSRGNGLGLYILSRCLRPMKGNVSVDSQPGAYSRFTVQLPRELK